MPYSIYTLTSLFDTTVHVRLGQKLAFFSGSPLAVTKTKEGAGELSVLSHLPRMATLQF